MKSLRLPRVEDYRTLITSCASGYAQERTRLRKERILGSIDALVCAGNKYSDLAAHGSLSEVVQSSMCGNATKEDLINLYEAKFVGGKAGEQGRRLYEGLKSSAPRGICPLCSQIPVTTLDHYLPKSRYPAYSIYPRNLVPACIRCNTNKLAKSEGLTLHPYYDNLEGLEWLRCSMQLVRDEIVLVYCVNNHIASPALRGRMINHLRDLGIAELYQASAISHLIEIREQLMMLGRDGGSGAVGEYLEEGLNTRKHASLNSWATALYAEISSCQWFIDGGYEKIEEAQSS